MNTLDPQYQKILKDFTSEGVESERGISIYAKQISHKMQSGFPLLTAWKLNWKPIVVEFLWCLRGENKIGFLHDYDCHVWDDLCYKNYKLRTIENIKDDQDLTESTTLLKKDFFSRIKQDKAFSEEWGNLGSTTGKKWRNFSSGVLEKKYKFGGVDQIDSLIKKLLSRDTNSNLVVSAFDPYEIYKESMEAASGDFYFQVFTRELSLSERIQWVLKNTDVELENVAITERAFDNSTPDRAISLTWNQSTVDALSQLPISIAKYGLLLQTLAHLTNTIPENLVGNFGEIILPHDQVKDVINYEGEIFSDLPKVVISDRNWFLHEGVKKYVGKIDHNQKILSFRPDCFELLNYLPQTIQKGKPKNDQ